MRCERLHGTAGPRVFGEIYITVGSALLAALFAAFALTRYIPALRAASGGITTQGEIIRIETRVNKSGVARPRPVVAFTASDGQRIVCDDVVPSIYVLEVGDEVPLRYLPNNPRKSATMATYREAIRAVAIVLSFTVLCAGASVVGLLALLGVI